MSSTGTGRLRKDGWPDLRRRWEIPLDSGAPRLARRGLISTLAPVVPPERLEDVVLAASELVTNAVRHSGARDRGSLAMSVELEGRSLRVQVEDPGPGFDPNRATQDGSLATSGFGLQLVERLSDRWGVASDGTTRVWFAVEL